ncbi:MAG TPA: DUF1127 domain-containing protein [Stellaceae bacterium]|nr:DUF1127 domain-containing protein [Alphaproteobacteria bacterium]HEV2161810.1 DUF1127 domain-containing protein [Stellaceae bacterium]
MLSLIGQASRALARRYATWRERQRAYAELASLDDRSLADIGINRAEIPYVLSHPRPARAPVWAKPGRTSHAH